MCAQGDRAKKKKNDDPTVMPVGRSITESRRTGPELSVSAPLNTRNLLSQPVTTSLPPRPRSAHPRSPHNMVHWGAELRNFLQPRKCEAGSLPWAFYESAWYIKSTYQSCIIQVPYV